MFYFSKQLGLNIYVLFKVIEVTFLSKFVLTIG